jgi:CheY-like chemotaxis protein
MSDQRSILVAEDDDSDVLFLRRAFKEAGIVQPVHFARDGHEAIEYLWGRRHGADDRMPALVILDLKMPRRSGMEVLHWIREQNVLRCLPVLIFSSSARREDIERAYALGANGFLVKPASTLQRGEVARFIKTWLQFNHPPLAATEGYQAAAAAHAVQTFNSPL